MIQSNVGLIDSKHSLDRKMMTSHFLFKISINLNSCFMSSEMAVNFMEEKMPSLLIIADRYIPNFMLPPEQSLKIHGQSITKSINNFKTLLTNGTQKLPYQ